jgi:hypothetical protein
VMGIPFHIREKKIPGSVDEPTADGRSPVRTLRELARPDWSPRTGTGHESTGHAERKLPVGQVDPAGPVKTGPGGTGPSHLT